jgi:hypothetical protein
MTGKTSVGTPADTLLDSLEIELQDESMSSLQSHSLGYSRELSQRLLTTPHSPSRFPFLLLQFHAKAFFFSLGLFDYICFVLPRSV